MTVLEFRRVTLYCVSDVRRLTEFVPATDLPETFDAFRYFTDQQWTEPRPNVRKFTEQFRQQTERGYGKSVRCRNYFRVLLDCSVFWKNPLRIRFRHSTKTFDPYINGKGQNVSGKSVAGTFSVILTDIFLQCTCVRNNLSHIRGPITACLKRERRCCVSGSARPNVARVVRVSVAPRARRVRRSRFHHQQMGVVF
jgi:hypothetical protein